MGWIFQCLSPSFIPLGALPFTFLRSVTVGSGRDFLEGDTYKGQSRGLLEPVDPVPVVAADAVHVDATTAEVQPVSVDAEPWGST